MSYSKMQAPTGSFMSFEHMCAMVDMSKRQQIKFVKMSNIQRACYLIDQANYKAVKAAHQSWDDYNPMALVRNSNQAIKKISTLTERFDDLTEQAQQMVSSFATMISGANNFLFGDVGRGVVLKLMNVIVNACLAKPGCLLLSLLYNISVQFGSEIYGYISQIFNFSSNVEANFQNEEIEDISMFGLLSSHVDANRGICAGTLGAILALVLLRALGLPGSSDVSTCLKFFGDRSRHLVNIFNLGKTATPMFSAIGEYLVNCAFGKIGSEHELENYLSGYDAWVEDILDICKPGQNLAQMVEKDKELCFRIDRLYRKGIEFAGVLGANKKLSNEPCVLHYNRVFKLIEEYKKLSDFSGVFGNKPRTKPLTVWIFGESGVGKSGMSWPLACDLNASLCDSLEEAQNYAKNIYFRNVEQEFWDGYNGANVCIYDDFGQRADSSASPNEEFMEVIRAANIAPYPLHVAQLEEKKRTKFCSQVLILTSNVLSQNTPSLTFPDAYRRRVDICVEVCLKEEFTKECYSKSTGGFVKRLDRSKCNSPVDTRPYVLKMYDPESQQPICDPATGRTKTIEYEEFVQMAIKQLMVSYQDSTMMNECMASRLDEARFNKLKKHAKFQMDDDYESADEYEPDETSTLRQRVQESIKTIRIKTQIACEKLPSLDEVRSSLRGYATSLIETAKQFKSYLLILSFLIGGVGLWKYFSNNKTQAAKKHGRCGLELEASASGDNVTCKSKKIVTEAFASGDSRTNKRNKVVVESDDVVCEAHCSADNSTRVKPKVVVESIPAEMQAWKDAGAQDLISHRVLTNMYKIIRVRDGKDQPLLNGLFVVDNVMLIPKHVRSCLQITDSIRMENYFGSIFEVPYSVIKQVDIEASNGYYKDAILWKFPRYVNAHTSLIKHFQTMPELSVRQVDVCLPTLRCINGTTMFAILGNVKCDMASIVFSVQGEEKNIRDTLCYTLNTIGGDCGAPVIVNDNSFLRKIAGIHSLGATDGTKAYGQSVTQADLKRALVKFDDVVETDADELPHFRVSSVELQLNRNYSQSDIQDLLRMPATTFGFVGAVSKVPFVPAETDIRTSLVHGKILDPITKPCYLYRSDVDLMAKNIAKCSVNTPYIPEEEVTVAVNEVKAHLLSNRRSELARVLTFEEAISGSESSEYISAINRSSSAGYPWVLNKPAGTHGKTGWLGDDQTFIYNEEVRRAVDARIAAAREGKRMPVAWTATLKDERRPIEKVDALKTRVFANGPMDYTITVRRYFLGFVAHVMENRVQNEQSIGTNPVGLDWTKTAKKLQKFGDKVFAGDFSSFDGTLNSSILSRFADVVNQFYDDGEENARIRRVLMLDVYNSFWICNGRYISLSHSQPSGNPLTTILNSFYNSVSMRIAYYRCAKMASIKAPNFDDVVSMVSYGDDNVINFSDGVISWFNQLTVTEAYASFGMIYTDEAKTGNMVASRKLNEVAYLKRGFRFVNGIYRAPMDLAVILETPNWIRKCPDFELECKLNIENSVRELAQHSEEVFSKWSKVLVKAFYDETNQYPLIKSYDSYNEEWDRDMGLLV